MRGILGPKARRLTFLAAVYALLLPGVPSADPLVASGDDLVLETNDVRIVPAASGGYDLFIRAKSGIGSVLLTESTKDPAMKADNFAYRASEYNQVNGDERRILNGKLLTSGSGRYSLVSSTPRPDERLGSAFHIYIPLVLVYGYPWSRSGTIAVGKGTYINIRTFSKQYADYTGAFKDNPYQIGISYRLPAKESVQAPATSQPPATQAPEQKTVAQPAPAEVPAGGEADDEPPPVQESPQVPLPSDGSVASKFGAILGQGAGGSLDLVLCLDTTASMVPYFDDIKKGLGPMLRARTAGYRSYRIGVVLYKDYWPDEYITRKFPFTPDISRIEGIVSAAVVYGGGDIPEALFEALYSAATDFDWSADRRQIIYLTDAAPHPNPKGKILFSDVLRETGSRRIDIDSVVVPDTISPPDPPHLLFENVRKRVGFMEATGGAPRRILVLVQGIDAQARLQDIPGELVAPLSVYSGLTFVGSRELTPETSAAGADTPWFAIDDAAALKAASESKADLLLLCSSIGTLRASDRPPTGAMEQTVSRLLDVASGKELARDVAWRVGMPSGAESFFVNGLREK